MKGLTEKQQRILDFIDDFQRREHMSPTVDEIAEHFGIRSPTAFAHVRALQQKGYVERTSKARSLTLKRAASPHHLSLTLSVPILGRISAGLPLLSEQNVEETFQIDPHLLPRGIGGERIFGLRVNGTSMVGAGINDGDIILAKEQHSPRTGDIVIALVDGETTVKYFYIRGGKVELRPANKAFKSQFYPFDEVAIQGKVIGLFHVF